MTAHELVIRLGRPFDIRTTGGAFLADVREITIPFADRESAEAAQREISVCVRPVHDAGSEDYRPVVAGEVVREPAEIEGALQPSCTQPVWDGLYRMRCGRLLIGGKCGRHGEQGPAGTGQGGGPP